MDTNSCSVRNKRVSSRSGETGSARMEQKHRIRKCYRKTQHRRARGASDGELYILIREYMNQKDEQRVDDYRNRLSRCKQISLDGLLERVLILQRLDHLRIFPGILDGLELGNVHKHLSLHYDSSIIQFLGSHVKETWLDITGKDPNIQQYVDPVTVRRLQFRVPASSSSDRRSITQMFDNGDVFEGISDAKVRERLKQNVLAVQVVIPSVQTFHENMKFFSLGVKIIRKTIADPSPRGSWLSVLMKHWRLPTVPYVETKHGCLRPLAAPQLTANLAFKQLLLAALRNFPFLCSENPRQDKRGESMPAYPRASMVVYLSELAFSLGFNNDTIKKNLKQEIEEHSSVGFQPEPGPLADWRGGKPFIRTFFALRSQAFLLQLSQPVTAETEPSPLFIMKDFMAAFFGSFDTISLDKDVPPMTLAAAAVSAMGFTTKHVEGGVTMPWRSRSQRTTAQKFSKGKSPYRVEKSIKVPKGTRTKAKFQNSLVRLSDSLPTYSRPPSSSSTISSMEKQGFENGGTFARQFYRSPIPSPETRNRNSDIQGSVFGERPRSSGASNHSGLDTMPGDDRPHRDSRHSTIPSFSTLNSRFSGQTMSTASSTLSALTLGSPRSQSSGLVAARSGKSEGAYTMPDRNNRSYLGQGPNESRGHGQVAVRIPPIRSMRSVRKPHSGWAASRLPPSQGSTVEQASLDGRSQRATGRIEFSIDPAAERTRFARVSGLVVPATPLRPEANGSRHSGAFFSWGVNFAQDAGGGEAAHFARGEGNGLLPSTTRRHAVYIPSTAERRDWLGPEKMPFGRPG